MCAACACVCAQRGRVILCVISEEKWGINHESTPPTPPQAAPVDTDLKSVWYLSLFNWFFGRDLGQRRWDESTPV